MSNAELDPILFKDLCWRNGTIEEETEAKNDFKKTQSTLYCLPEGLLLSVDNKNKKKDIDNNNLSSSLLRESPLSVKKYRTPLTRCNTVLPCHRKPSVYHNELTSLFYFVLCLHFIE